MGDVITAEDCWSVISSFFETKGLVSQQLDSFDEFAAHTIQDLAKEHDTITLDQNAPVSEDDDDPIIIRRYEIKLGQIWLSQPRYTEANGESLHMFPQESHVPQHVTEGLSRPRTTNKQS